ncbi:hypothetical protein ACWGOQ_0006650 [Aquimarina sp. M1]
MKYQNRRSFRLWEYSVSHSSLLIRSEKQYSDVFYDEKYNPNVTLDIEFWGVDYINLPIDFKYMEIHKIVDNFPVKFPDFFKKDSKLFKINEKYHIIAAGCIIGQSIWDADESRLHNPLLNYDNIILTM